MRVSALQSLLVIACLSDYCRMLNARDLSMSYVWGVLISLVSRLAFCFCMQVLSFASFIFVSLRSLTNVT